jgi:predicted DNA-binding transcriptional regulator AlpA
MTPPLSLNLEQVALALSMSPKTFIRRRPRLQRDYSFPRPLPGCGSVWSAALVEAWIRAGGVPAEPEPVTPPQTARQKIIDEARQNLEARYGVRRD